jgi:hypothetical protein
MRKHSGAMEGLDSSGRSVGECWMAVANARGKRGSNCVCWWPFAICERRVRRPYRLLEGARAEKMLAMHRLLPSQVSSLAWFFLAPTRTVQQRSSVSFAIHTATR